MPLPAWVLTGRTTSGNASALTQASAEATACSSSRENRRVGGERIDGSPASMALTPSRVRLRINAGSLFMTGPGKSASNTSMRSRTGRFSLDFADRHEGHVMRGQVVEADGVGIDVMQPEHAIAARQQEIQRRVGHEIAGRDERQQPGPMAVAVHDAEVALQRHRALQDLAGLLGLAEAVQDRGEIEHGGGIGAVARQRVASARSRAD